MPRIPTRILAIATVVTAGAAVLAVVLLGGSSAYRIHARFLDAGQLVEGDLVEVGGVPIGSVDRIDVSPAGQADLTLDITDDRFSPLHAGTTATIRAAGAAGVANRYVAITPGPSSAATIRSGSALPSTATHGIVDLDMLLDSLDPATRGRLVAIFGNGAHAFASAGSANRAFALLNPALSQASVLMSELGHDRRALSDVVASSGRTLQQLDTGHQRLGVLVDDLATSLRAIARRRGDLADVLARTSSVLGRTRTSLAGIRRALPAVGAMLVAARPAAAPLAAVLRRLPGAAQALTPALAALRAQLPAAGDAFAGLPALARAAVPALRSATRAIRDVTPIFRGLRPYTPDFVGAAEWVGGSLTSTYDAQGHYGRLTPLVGEQALGGLGSILHLNLPSTLPTLVARSDQVARCPGGAAEPARDGSNPWIADPSACNPGDDQ